MLRISRSNRLLLARPVLAWLLLSLYALSLPQVASPQLYAQNDSGQSLALPSAPMPKSYRVPLAKALKTRGDLSLQDTPMEKALFTIGASWKVNVVVGKDVEGTVSCVYRNTPLREVLDAILLANGYSYRAVGESLVVQKTQEVGSANPLFQSAAIPITHSDMQEIVEGARMLLSTRGQIQALESARSILVVDFADRVAMVRDFVAQMDAAAAKSTGGIPAENYRRLQIAYFHTQYIPVDNAKEPLNAVLSNVGRVATMPEENRMIVTDYASNIEMVRKVLAKIDQPRPQVRITALIYDISLQDVEQLGLNWNSAGKGNNLDDDGNPQQSITLDTMTLVPFSAGSPGGTFTIQSLTRNFDITAIALLLQNANDARLLADPHVTVEDNETADMSSVQEIPFQQLTQSSLGGNIGTTAFKEVGIKLEVTPRVAADGTVQMLIKQEFGRLAGFSENDNQPIIDTRTANTTVRVANRQTLVISGLRIRSDTGDFNGIPFLKDIRYIGPLFRSRNTIVRESELIVFIMPEIITYDQPSLPREYLAQETVGCRLARVPAAEGCAGPAGVSCSAGADEAPVITDQLLQLPTVEGEILHESPSAPQQTPPSAALKGQIPFRQGFEDRYRATGGTDSRRQRFVESASRQQPTRDAKSPAWKRMFGL